VISSSKDKKDDVDVVESIKDQQVNNFSLHYYECLLKKSKILFVIFFIGAFVGASIFGLWPKSYKSQVVVQVKGTNSKGGGISALAGLAGVAGVMSAGDQTYEANMGFLRSKEMMRSFIIKNKIETKIISSKLFFGFDFFDAKGGENEPNEYLVEKSRIILEKNVNFDEDRKTGLTTISLTWSDSTLAKDWANEYVKHVNDELRQVAISRAQQNLDHVNSQIPKTEIVAVQQALYKLLEEQVKTIMLATVDSEYGIRVIDPATKQMPYGLLKLIEFSLMTAILFFITAGGYFIKFGENK
jgi:uncharacterized protein involved in exopolysaccharide biosynthesis